MKQPRLHSPSFTQSVSRVPFRSTAQPRAATVSRSIKMTKTNHSSGACLAQLMGMARFTTRRSRLRDAVDGFSLIELMVVAAIAAVLMGIAVPVTDMFIRSTRADSSVSAATNAIDMAHDRAVSERRNYVLTFVPPNRIQLGRQDINAAGVVISTTQTDEFILEGGQTFLKFTG